MFDAQISINQIWNSTLCKFNLHIMYNSYYNLLINNNILWVYELHTWINYSLILSNNSELIQVQPQYQVIFTHSTYLSGDFRLLTCLISWSLLIQPIYQVILTHKTYISGDFTHLYYKLIFTYSTYIPGDINPFNLYIRWL